MPTSSRPFWRSRWWMPGFCVLLGLLILGAAWIGDNRDEGLTGLAVMTALALVFLFGQRSDTLAGLGGPGRDEPGRRSTCVPRHSPDSFSSASSSAPGCTSSRKAVTNHR